MRYLVKTQCFRGVLLKSAKVGRLVLSTAVEWSRRVQFQVLFGIRRRAEDSAPYLRTLPDAGLGNLTAQLRENSAARVARSKCP